MSASFRDFTTDDAVRVAAAALSRAAAEPVAIEDITPLGEEQRRNHIIRAVACGASGGRQPIVIKATRAADYDATSEDIVARGGIASEWAAASLLDHRGAPTARFLAGDAAAGVIVFADLGADVPWLARPLLNGAASEAEAALLGYATSLGHLHAATAGCSDTYAAAVHASYPHARVPQAIGERWLARAAAIGPSLLGGVLPEPELAVLAQRMRDPGPWLGLVHGDPCPDNVLLTVPGPVLLDFEFAAPGHALIDAAYWRMGFPTCWCAGRIPDTVAERVELAYRDALAGAIPQARDDAAFHGESAIAVVIRLFASLEWHLDPALKGDSTWGIATKRNRILWHLQAAIAATTAFRIARGLAARLSHLADRSRKPLAGRAAAPRFSGVRPRRSGVCPRRSGVWRVVGRLKDMAEPELSRRDLIHLVGKAGGVAAAYHTMAAMGLLAVPQAYAGPPALPPGHGRRVVIIGAGIAGMVLAYELRKSGYQPQILEARPRPGGRNWSLRGGDTVTETTTTQHVAWDRAEQLYFNPGPARLPYHHEGILVILPHARRAARGDVQRQPRRTDAGRQGLRWRAAAQPAGGERRARLRRGVGGEGDRPGVAGAAGQRGRQGTAARLPPRVRCAGQGPCLSRLAACRVDHGARCHASRHAEPAVGPATDSGLGFLARPDAVRRTLHHGSDHAATGRGHGPHRPGIRPRTARRHHLPGGGNEADPHRDRRAHNLATRRTAAPSTGSTRRSSSSPFRSRHCATSMRISRRRRARRWPRSITCPREKSRSRPPDASGSWISRFTAAFPGPAATRPKSGIRQAGYTAKKASWSVPISGRTTLATHSPPNRSHNG